MLPLDPLTVTIGFLCWMAFRRQAGTQFGQMTPEREEVFKNAMQYLGDPQRMQALAEEFHKEGLKFQALMLKKRAEWNSRTREMRAKHSEIITKAMASTNVQAILAVAQAFQEMTATVIAGKLRDHAKEVWEAGQKKQEEETKQAVDKAVNDVNESFKKANGATAPVVPTVIETKGEPAPEAPPHDV